MAIRKMPTARRRSKFVLPTGALSVWADGDRGADAGLHDDQDFAHFWRGGCRLITSGGETGVAWGLPIPKSRFADMTAAGKRRFHI